MKLFLDTSVLVRYFTNDDLGKANEVRELLGLVESGKVRVYTSSVVISELMFVLMRLYKLKKAEALDKANLVLEMRNMVLEEKTDTRRALEWFGLFGVKLGDCMIATQIPKGVGICTYDADFSKIPGVKVVDPGEVKTQ